MTIAIGDRIPDVQLRMITDHGVEVASTADVLGKGRVVLFGMPAAFSGPCSDTHLPGYLVHRGRAVCSAGVDRIFGVCRQRTTTRNGAWARSQALATRWTLLCGRERGSWPGPWASTSTSLNLAMGTRNQRYAPAVLQDGIVTHLGPSKADRPGGQHCGRHACGR